MRDEIKGSSTDIPTHGPTQVKTHDENPGKNGGNAFSPRFLEAIQARDKALRKASRHRDAQADRRGLCAGPFEVEEVEPIVDHSLGRPSGRAFAVVRRARPAAEGGGSVAVCGSYADALHLAAIVPAIGTANHLWLAPERPRGVPLHDGRRFLAHVVGDGPAAVPELPHYLHVARCLTGNLESLALLHRALGAEALALLGRRLMRWMA